MLPARVVFDVAMEGTARKVITVRSALVIDNQLDEPVEISLRKGTSVIGNELRHSLLMSLFFGFSHVQYIL